MKFTLTAKQQPEFKVMDDNQFAAFVDGLEVFLDTIAAGNDTTKEEALENLRNVRELVDAVDAEQLKAYIASEEELSAVFDGSVENFKKLLDENIKASTEGMVRDWFESFGGIITAFIKRNNHTVAYLEPALAQLKEKIKKVPEDRFQFRVFRMSIASKYLPSYDQFVKATDALIKLVNYCKSTAPEQFDGSKVNEMLANTIFESKKSNANLGAGKGIGFFIPVVGAFVWAHENADVRQRGWSSAETFNKGIDLASKLVDALKVASDTVSKLQTIKSEAADDAKKGAKEMLKVLKFVSKEGGFMCRGLVVAGKKITSGFISRLGQGLVD